MPLQYQNNFMLYLESLRKINVFLKIRRRKILLLLIKRAISNWLTIFFRQVSLLLKCAKFFEKITFNFLNNLLNNKHFGFRPARDSWVHQLLSIIYEGCILSLLLFSICFNHLSEGLYIFKEKMHMALDIWVVRPLNQLFTWTS